jgi:hypothetical protein
VIQSERRQGERFQAALIAEYDQNGGGPFMVWEVISLDGRTDLVQNRGTMTGQRYIDDILDNQVRLYAAEAGDRFILMDDNARHHRVRMVQDYQER